MPRPSSRRSACPPPIPICTSSLSIFRVRKLPPYSPPNLPRSWPIPPTRFLPLPKECTGRRMDNPSPALPTHPTATPRHMPSSPGVLTNGHQETLKDGNILRGWDGYLGKQASSGAIRRINRFREADRMFSASSVTSGQASTFATAGKVPLRSRFSPARTMRLSRVCSGGGVSGRAGHVVGWGTWVGWCT